MDVRIDNDTCLDKTMQLISPATQRKGGKRHRTSLINALARTTQMPPHCAKSVVGTVREKEM